MAEEILQFATKYTLYSGCITFGFGIIGNFINFLVFTQLKLFRNNRCAFYLTVESISNFLYQCVSISLTILTSIYGDDATGRSLVWCRFRYISSQSLVLTTSSMICLAAIDQFLSTNHHVTVRQICTLKLGQYFTLIFICIWIIHSTIFGFFIDIQSSVGCAIFNYIWLQYSTFFFYPVLIGLLPVFITALFSILAFRNVRRIVRRQLLIVRRRLDRQMTAMVLMRTLMVSCLGIPYGIYRVYTINNPISKNKPMEYAIGRLIQAIFLSFTALNYTISFYIFLIISPRFRHQVKFLAKRYWKHRTYWCCFRSNQVNPKNPETIDTGIELEECS